MNDTCMPRSYDTYVVIIMCVRISVSILGHTDFCYSILWAEQAPYEMEKH